MLTIKEYRKAESLEEAWQLNQKRPNRIIGGMVWLKMCSLNVQTAIDLSGLGLDGIEEQEDSFSIGCMVTLRQLETHPGLDRYTNGAMKEALRHIVGVQFRNVATVGGSLFGRYGFSDVLTAFMAMDAQVELYKGGLIPIRGFAEMPYDRDVLVRVVVKKTPAAYFYQSMRNTDTDFPALTCAAARTAEGLRICIGARPGKAVLLSAPEELLQAPFSGEKAKQLAAYAAKQIPTGSNMRGSAEYRTHLVEVLTKRAAEHLTKTAYEDTSSGQKESEP